MAYHAFSEQEAVEYARKLPGIFSENAVLESREIGDGNLNLVFHIKDKNSDKSVIFKQALPYARVVGESMPLTLDRSRIESEALIIQDQLCPGYVPKVYHYDKELALTVMEDLSDHVIMRRGLIEGNRYPKFSEHIGLFMARTLFLSSDFALGFKEKKERVAQFINPELCKITEDLVFTDPYFDAESNNFNPLIRAEVEKIWNNAILKSEIAKLKFGFMTEAQTLLHGDLHTGSIMVTKESTKVIDPEFAYYGPMGFDIGALIANLLLSFAAQEGWKEDPLECQDYRSYLSKTIIDLWLVFEQEFRALWKEHVKDPMYSSSAYVDEFVARLLKDSAGYAGCKMMRRVIGLAGVADLKTIEDEQRRAKAEILALEIGQALVMSRHSLTSVDELVEIAKKAVK